MESEGFARLHSLFQAVRVCLVAVTVLATPRDLGQQRSVRFESFLIALSRELVGTLAQAWWRLWDLPLHREPVAVLSDCHRSRKKWHLLLMVGYIVDIAYSFTPLHMA